MKHDKFSLLNRLKIRQGSCSCEGTVKHPEWYCDLCRDDNQAIARAEDAEQIKAATDGNLIAIPDVIMEESTRKDTEPSSIPGE